MPENERPDSKEDQEDKGAGGNRRTSSPVGGIVLVLLLIIGSASAAVLASRMAAVPAPGDAAAAANVAAAEAADPAAEPGTEGAETNGSGTKFDVSEEIDMPLVVNVYRTQGRRFVAVRPIFDLQDAKTRDILKDKEVELMHILLTILKSKTLDDLDAPEAVNTLAREIQETVNLELELNGGIRNVYFTQFQVQ